MNAPSARQAFFVTGTDTGVGKTLVAAMLIRLLADRGLRVAGMKPVASGAFFDGAHWRSEDVDALRAASNVDLPAHLVNPYLFKEATAPHIAAAAEGVRINLAHLERCCREIEMAAEAVIVEGAGGFMVPLGEDGAGDDLAKRLGLPVIIVVGIRLGCINHALLTQQAILAKRLSVAGWVANIIDPAERHATAMVDSLASLIHAPLLGRLPWSPGIDAHVAAQHVRLPS